MLKGLETNRFADQGDYSFRYIEQLIDRQGGSETGFRIAATFHELEHLPARRKSVRFAKLSCCLIKLTP